MMIATKTCAVKDTITSTHRNIGHTPKYGSSTIVTRTCVAPRRVCHAHITHDLRGRSTLDLPTYHIAQNTLVARQKKNVVLYLSVHVKKSGVTVGFVCCSYSKISRGNSAALRMRAVHEYLATRGGARQRRPLPVICHRTNTPCFFSMVQGGGTCQRYAFRCKRKAVVDGGTPF